MNISFIAGSRKINTINDLKEILSKAPEELIVPIQDGRLERFLNSIDPHLLEHINRNDPESSIKVLAKILGVEVKEIKRNDTRLKSQEQAIELFFHQQ